MVVRPGQEIDRPGGFVDQAISIPFYASRLEDRKSLEILAALDR
jgi:hypothetical protein